MGGLRVGITKAVSSEVLGFDLPATANDQMAEELWRKMNEGQERTMMLSRDTPSMCHDPKHKLLLHYI